MKRIFFIWLLGGAMLLSALSLCAAAPQTTLNAFQQAVTQPNAVFSLRVSDEVALPLQWRESRNSFSSQGIRTYVGKLHGETLAYLSVDAQGRATGSLLYGQGYDISADNGRLVLTPMRHVARECGLEQEHAPHTSSTRNAGWAVGRAFEAPVSFESVTPRATGITAEAPHLGDGIFRVYRLAVFMSYKEFSSEKFDKDFNKVKTFWAQLETFLNEIYVRDLGVQFKIISDERLVEKAYKQDYKYTAGTGLINDAIGEDNYDVGILLDYQDGSGLGGLARLGAARRCAISSHKSCGNCAQSKHAYHCARAGAHVRRQSSLYI